MKMQEVTKEILFEDLFPPKCSRKQRIKRWKEWKSLVANEPEALEYWATDVECFDCPEYCQKDDWCNFGNLPPSVNPYLSFKHGMSGLACMGLRPRKEGETKDLKPF